MTMIKKKKRLKLRCQQLREPSCNLRGRRERIMEKKTYWRQSGPSRETRVALTRRGPMTLPTTR